MANKIYINEKLYGQKIICEIIFFTYQREASIHMWAYLCVWWWSTTKLQPNTYRKSHSQQWRAITTEARRLFSLALNVMFVCEIFSVVTAMTNTYLSSNTIDDCNDLLVAVAADGNKWLFHFLPSPPTSNKRSIQWCNYWEYFPSCKSRPTVAV